MKRGLMQTFHDLEFLGLQTALWNVFQAEEIAIILHFMEPVGAVRDHNALGRQAKLK